MIRTRSPPCAIRESLFLPAPIRCAADHASRALNALLGLAVADAQTDLMYRRGERLGSRRHWVATSGFELADDYLR
jgi:hypothetical protein